MKKTFTLVAGALIALGASAQVANVWSTSEGLEALGLSGDATELAEGTFLAENETGTFANRFTDNVKTTSIKADGVKYVAVNNVEYEITTGTTGSTNPAGIGIENAPTAGWVYKITVAQDGYVTLFSKLSSNKPYYVFESESGLDAYMLLNYDLGMMFQGEVRSYSLPGGEEDGYFNMSLTDADKYSDGTSLRWPEKIFLGADAADVKKNGFGYISFPALAGFDYLFCAQGSKANTNGFIWTPEKPTQIAAFANAYVDGDGVEHPEVMINYVGEYTSGINDIITETVDANAPVYNIYGQQVSKDTKGLLISKGVKYYNR